MWCRVFIDRYQRFGGICCFHLQGRMGVVKMKTAGFSEIVSVQLHNATFENAVNIQCLEYLIWYDLFCVHMELQYIYCHISLCCMVRRMLLPRRPGFSAGNYMRGFWWTKWRWGWFKCEFLLGCLANHHPTINLHSSITGPWGMR
jgi:hypothetical protein